MSKPTKPGLAALKTDRDHFLYDLMERCDSVPQGAPVVKDGESWTKESIQQYDALFAAIAKCFNLTTYPNTLTIINSKQMLEAYSTVALPVMYNHSSFGKKYLQQKQAYDNGEMGLAYEIVINSSPCISYNMFGNPAHMQALVIAHAAYGHNSFFKNNYMFKDHTDAESILPYLRYAKEYIDKCYERIGVDAVEQVLDSCHAIQMQGVNRCKRSANIKSEADRLRRFRDMLETGYDPLTGKSNVSPEMMARAHEKAQAERFQRKVDYSQGCENIMYALEKESPGALASEVIGGSPWMVEVIRIVRNISQYFYPQKQTQVMNEGWATFWHHAMTTVAHHKGYLTQKQYTAILHSHTNVVYQPSYNDPYYSGINPYHLGWKMYGDIKFIAQGPQNAEELKRWEEYKYEETFKNHTVSRNGKTVPLIGCDWLEAMHYAMENHRDESFISQYLTPERAQKEGLFAMRDDDREDFYEVIGAGADFEEVRQALSEQYNLSKREPDINAVGFDIHGDRVFRMVHTAEDGAPLDERHAQQVLKHINCLLRGPSALADSRAFRAYKADIITKDTRDPHDPISIRYNSKR